MSSRPRLLLAITVYNGRAFVPRCLTSAAALRTETVDVDVLVLDDCSPEPGFSEAIATQCAELGIQYYRSPRNLGITRNVSLGLARGLEAGYDGVIISNSDVLYPGTFADHLWAVAQRDPAIGSVTAFSNNVSAYSLPNTDPDRHLADQRTVDAIAGLLWDEFGDGTIDVPAGISFSMLFTRAAIEDVGLMDTVFGRGYCEETDWSRRSLAAGWRLTLAPGVFVYHSGRGSTLAAGMVSGEHTTVPENEAIIHLRYPTFHEEVGRFVNESGVLPQLWGQASRAITVGMAKTLGYDVHVSAFDREANGASRPLVRIELDESSHTADVTFTSLGFTHTMRESFAGLEGSLRSMLGSAPVDIRVYQAGRAAEALAVALEPQGDLLDLRGYPEKV